MGKKTTYVSKHEEISRTLREEAVAGKFGGEGGRLPSEAQLVKRFQASRPTVARALRTLQDEKLVERRAGAGTFLLPKSSQESLNSRRTLALLIPDLRNTEIFQQISGEIASLARVNEFNIIWGGSGQPKLDVDNSLKHGLSLCEQFIEQQVDGVFFAPYELVKGRHEANRTIAKKLHDAGIPLILIDKDFAPHPQRSPFDLVGTDNFCGGYELAQHLIKLGAKSLCFVHPERSASTIIQRILGVRAAMEDHGLNWSKHSIFEGDPSDAVFLRKVLGQGRPDALIGANDYTSALLLQNLIKQNIQVPQEIRVVGFDDVSFATLVSPPMTTVTQPCREIAVTAFNAMAERIENPSLPTRHISLSPRLIIRDSCGAYL